MALKTYLLLLHVLVLQLILTPVLVFSSEAAESSQYSAPTSSGPVEREAVAESRAWPLRIPFDRVVSAHLETLVDESQSSKRVQPANYTRVDSSELEIVEETTDRTPRQSGSGILFRNSVYNPALTPSYNPYDPLSQRYDPLDPRYNQVNPRYDPRTTTNFNGIGPTTFNGIDPLDGNGLDAFSARRASQSTQGRGAKIIFTDTITQLGTSWNSQTSEFSPTVPGIFYFSFNAISDRYTYFRVSLQLNGGDVVSAFGDINGYQMAGNSALVKMNEGDRVYLTLQEGRLFDVSSSRAYTTFSGFRVL